MQVPVEETQVREEKGFEIAEHSTEEAFAFEMQRECIRQAQQGNKEARDAFVRENMGLVYHIVRRFQGRGYDMEDLCQIGCIGLIKAIDNFDTNYDVRFSTYAVYLIQGEIRRFLRDDGLIKVSRTLKENGAKIYKEKERLQQSMNKEPTLKELSEATGLSKEEIVMAMEANAEVDSIDREVMGESTFKESKILHDNGDESETVLNKILLEQLLALLNEEERQLIMLRYRNNMTQMEVAAKLNISQVQVSRKEKKILERLRQSVL